MEPLVGQPKQSKRSYALVSLVLLGTLASAYVYLGAQTETAAFGLQQQALKDLFSQWKLVHGKVYEDVIEEEHRFAIFTQNYNGILEWNAGDNTETLALNQFADLTNSEFAAQQTTTFPEVEVDPSKIATFAPQDLPTSFDWRTKGAVTPVKNQGQCGSCWAFSSTGALEGLNFVTTGSLSSFSEQQLVDCDKVDQGCNGGLQQQAFQYTASNGIMLENDYPYTAKDGQCQYSSSKAANVNSNYNMLQQKSVSALQNSAYTQPTSIAVQASGMNWQFYSGGVISTCGAQLDHGVLVAGWDQSQGKDGAWLVKNSWGTTWGNQGYLWISMNGKANYGKGVCGILMNGVVPTK